MGVIDWDSVAAWPRSLGNRRYPSWLTRDWDPVMYGYEDGKLTPGMTENSPAELARYRKVYREAMSKISPGHELETSATLVIESVTIAARKRKFRYGILKKIFQEISHIVKLPEDVELYDVCYDLGFGELEEEIQEKLRDGFSSLLRISL